MLISKPKLLEQRRSGRASLLLCLTLIMCNLTTKKYLTPLSNCFAMQVYWNLTKIGKNLCSHQMVSNSFFKTHQNKFTFCWESMWNICWMMLMFKTRIWCWLRLWSLFSTLRCLNLTKFTNSDFQKKMNQHLNYFNTILGGTFRLWVWLNLSIRPRISSLLLNYFKISSLLKLVTCKTSSWICPSFVIVMVTSKSL